MKPPRRTLRPGAGWPIGIVVVLAGFVVGNVAVMRIADQPAALAHDRDYYRRAVNFDAERAMAARNARRGWQVAVVAPAATAAGALHIRLSDAAGRPLEGATVRASAFHLAHADDVRATAGPAAPGADPGAYDARIALDRPGRWDVTLDVWREQEHLVVTRRLEVRRGP